MISGFFWVCFLSLIKNPLQTLCQSTRLHFVSFLHHNWSLLRSSLRGYVKEITTTRKSWKSPRAIHFVRFSTLAFRYPMFFSRFIYSHKRRIKRKWDYTWSRALTSLWRILWSTSSQKDKTWYYCRNKHKSLSKHLKNFFMVSESLVQSKESKSTLRHAESCQSQWYLTLRCVATSSGYTACSQSLPIIIRRILVFHVWKRSIKSTQFRNEYFIVHMTPENMTVISTWSRILTEFIISKNIMFKFSYGNNYHLN